MHRRPATGGHIRRNHRVQEEKSTPCQNGPRCGYKRNGACKFSHHHDSTHGEWQLPRRQHGFRRHRGWEHREEPREEPRWRDERYYGEPEYWYPEGERPSQRHHEYQRSFWGPYRNNRN